MKMWAFNVILCVDEHFIYACIKVLQAICEQMNGSKLINLP